MAISVKHAFQSAKADGPDSTLVQPSSWNAEHTITAAAGVVLGRNTSGAGAIQELPIAVDVSGNVALGGALSVDGNTTLGNASTDSVTVNAASFSFANATTIAGKITYIGAVSFNGNTTLGDASTDTVTLNAGTVSIPNNVNFSGGNVGVGTSLPGAKLDVTGAIQSKPAAGTFPQFNLNSLDSGKWKSLIAFQNSGTNKWEIGVDPSNNGTNAFYIYDNAASAERMRIDSAGNVGVGLADPSQKLDVAGGISLRPGGSVGANAVLTADASSGANGISLIAGFASGGYGPIKFVTSATERMRIDSAGVVLVGTASATGIYNGSSFNSGVAVEQVGSISAQRNNGPCLWLSKATGYTESTFINFSVSALGKGSIYYNSGTGQVVYAVTSDYRAKDILGPVQDSGATIDALKVYTGKMHGATMPYPMMVAHEVQEVVPFAVSGEKDAVNEDDTPKYQQMDLAILVPLLIAELQSIRARLAALEARP